MTKNGVLAAIADKSLERIVTVSPNIPSTRATPPGALADDVPPPAKTGAATLIEIYNHWFEIVQATDEALCIEAFRLRYQVYCVENPFEDPTENPDGLETDEFDARSVHSLLIHRPTETVAGCVRLVLPTPTFGTVRLVLPEGGRKSGSLPIHQVCDHPALLDPAVLPPETTAEISRFAISKAFRRRRQDGLFPDSIESAVANSIHTPDRRLLPHMTLGLLKGVMEMSAEHGITHWCAVLEPALLRLLGRLGLHLTPIGPTVQYHGLRQPAYVDIAELAARTKREGPEVWEMCTEGGRLLAKLPDPAPHSGGDERSGGG